jgi:poly(3-hydroxybutyrate) depolymerase
VLDDLARAAKCDAKRVYAAGMSMGAITAYRLASELSDRIAAIATVAGPMGTETCSPKRPVSVIHFHGTGRRGRALPGRARKTGPLGDGFLLRRAFHPGLGEGRRV